MNNFTSEKNHRISSLKNEVFTNRNAINNMESAIINIKSSQFPADYIERQVLQREERITLYKKRLDELLEKIKSIEEGNYDNEIEEELNKKLKVLKVQEEKKKKIITTSPKKEKRIEREHRPQDFDREYRRMNKITDFLPNYIKKNLSEMPNNKGYIFKGIWFYGNLPLERGQPIVLFEKPSKDVLLIHEYMGRYYSLYRKEGNQPKKLIKSY